MNNTPSPPGLLFWRSRRGMLELDLLLLPFLESRWATLGEELQAQYVRLLEEDDPTLWDWLRGDIVPPDDLRPIVRLIRRD